VFFAGSSGFDQPIAQDRHGRFFGQQDRTKIMTDVMKGVRILEVAEHMFVPAASAILSDWGADVIKVEHHLRGDAMRGLGSTGVLDLSKGVHVLNEHSNRGKRSIGLDLSSAEGVQVLYELAKTCDVFLTNKLPEVLEKLQIDVPHIRKYNRDIIYVRGTASGPRGPDGNRGGYDMTSFWCRSGCAYSVSPLWGLSCRNRGRVSVIQSVV
jgi:crotonobetainyl-CoA:carnitine CoA-transferase CaiB-like acyl-CoA transferase